MLTRRQLISNGVDHSDGFRRMIQQTLNPCRVEVTAIFSHSVAFSGAVRRDIDMNSESLSGTFDVLVDRLARSVAARVKAIRENIDFACIRNQLFPQLVWQPDCAPFECLFLYDGQALCRELTSTDIKHVPNAQPSKQGNGNS